MKTSIPSIALALAVLPVSGFGSIQEVVAQEPPQAAQEITSPQTRLIRMKNVAPSIMAWWLDPAHNTEPIVFRYSRTVAEGVLPAPEKDPAKPLGDYKLPDGIERLVPIDPQNALLVAGTATDLSEIKKVIASLDKPLKQVEIEVQYLEISDADLKKLGPKNFTKASEKDAISWAVLTPLTDLKRTEESVPKGFVSGSAIAELLNTSKARLITAPRVTAIDNLSASLRSTTSIPFILASETAIPTYTDPDAQCMLYWTSGLGITVRPTINKDRTISLALAPGLTLQLQAQAKEVSKTIPQKQQGLETVWQRQLGGTLNLPTIESGQKLAVMGLKSDSLLTRAPSDKSKPTNVLLLVRANLIHRAGDDEN